MVLVFSIAAIVVFVPYVIFELFPDDEDRPCGPDGE